MDLALSEDQQAVQDSFSSFFAKEVPPALVRSAEPLGFDAHLWERVVGLGVPAMAVGGASLLDLALVCEQAGARLAPVPIVEAFVTTRALAAGPPGRDGVAADLAGVLPAVLDGTRLATIALRPARLGVLGLVPAGAVADVVVALDGDRLVLVAGTPPMAGPANLGSSPLADRAVDGGSFAVASGTDAVRAHRAAVAEWKTLTAAALVGLGGAALALGVEYVKGRHQFGVAVGSFQAVQHRLAEVATAIDGARLLAYRAAWAMEQGATDAEERAAAALLFAGEAAQQATTASLHFHGGYGFMLEFDVQLFFRRAKAWWLAGGDPRRQLREVGDLRYGPVGAG